VQDLVVVEAELMLIVEVPEKDLNDDDPYSIPYDDRRVDPSNSDGIVVGHFLPLHRAGVKTNEEDDYDDDTRDYTGP
jgi:hypothetical protein